MTDHRIKLTLHRLESILGGDLDEIIDSLIAADQAAKLSSLNEEEYNKWEEPKMKKTALVIMAAGMEAVLEKESNSFAPVGPNGEIIMDYSIHDALEAGFNKVVFIIRKDLEDEFKK